jgi:hypothetical protein|tara:strand:- start:330 stop:1076 length:747 start_codon:yes stop_codon:yes gene_type:complete
MNTNQVAVRRKRKTTTMFSRSLADKIKNRSLVEVEIVNLNINPMNPPERVETNTAFLTLKRGVRELGVLDVVHFCGDTMTLINGHRRVESARLNGITSLTAYRYDGLTEEERNILFRHLNTTSVSYSGSQKLHTFLKGGTVDSAFARACNDLIDIGDSVELGNGMQFLTTIRNKKKSPSSYMIGVKEYCKVVGSDSMKTKAKVLDWMMNIGSAHRIKALIHLKCPAHLLKKAINGRRPITGTWEITAV